VKSGLPQLLFTDRMFVVEWRRSSALLGSFEESAEMLSDDGAM
jgi:hypothetical protein